GPASVREQAGEELAHLAVGPLSVGAIHALLLARLGRPFARQTLLRIHELSGGNPFFAVELARAVDLDGDALDPLRVPGTLEEAVRARLAGLPPATRQALALAAALGTAREDVLARAGVDESALQPALAAHVVVREDGALRFTHPLLASVLYQDLAEERPAVHGRLAQLVDDPLERARHLALSRSGPDAGVAAALDE